MKMSFADDLSREIESSVGSCWKRAQIVTEAEDRLEVLEELLTRPFVVAPARHAVIASDSSAGDVEFALLQAATFSLVASALSTVQQTLHSRDFSKNCFARADYHVDRESAQDEQA